MKEVIMPMSRAVARFNRYPNRIARRLAPYLPPFLLLTHMGRSSGKRYRTPVFGFRTDDGFVIALTYGRESDWVRNVLAAEGGEAVYRRRAYTLSEPRLVHGDPKRQPLPGVVRLVLPLLNVDDFLLVRAGEQ
jgi:deazaflavin-dependent oxidoreductase (nitroreductase family)